MAVTPADRHEGVAFTAMTAADAIASSLVPAGTVIGARHRLVAPVAVVRETTTSKLHVGGSTNPTGTSAGGSKRRDDAGGLPSVGAPIT